MRPFLPLFICCVLPAFLLTACKKNILKGNTTAEVYLRENGTDDPINGGQIYLYGAYVTGGGLSGGTSLSLIETYTTNADGYAYIDFKHKDYKEEDFDYYTLRGYAAQYYEDDTEYDLNTKEDNEITISLWAEAYLRVTIKNVSKTYNTIVIDDFGVPGGSGGELSGLDVNVSRTSRTLGNYSSVVWFTMYNDGDSYEDWINFKDTIYCPAHDTTDYYFEY